MISDSVYEALCFCLLALPNRVFFSLLSIFRRASHHQTLFCRFVRCNFEPFFLLLLTTTALPPYLPPFSPHGGLH